MNTASGITMSVLRSDALPHYEWLQVPVWVFDAPRQRMVWANLAGLQFWHSDSVDDLCARDFSDMTTATYQRLMASMQLHAQGQLVRERWTLYPRGYPMTTILVSRAFELPDGEPAILFCSEPLAASYDATMLRGIEAMQHTPVRVGLYRMADGAALMHNPAAMAAFGPVPDEPQPGELQALFVDQAHAHQVQQQVRQAQAFVGEAELNTQAGPRWHALEAHAVRDPVTGLGVMLLNARDISDLKAALAALSHARDAAESANRAKSAFLANMSHEIRTPMNAVMGLTELVLGGPLELRQRQHLELAQRSARALLRIIDDILDLSKIEADKLVLVPESMSLRGLLRDALATLRVQADAKSLSLTWTVDHDVPDQVLADAARLRQVLLNLVGNALKFTEQGSIDVQLECRMEDGDELLLACAVADTGVGMTEAQLGRLFEAFSQGDDSVSKRYGGTGLGLAIVKRLVQLMGGQVSAVSRPGEGTRVEFSFAARRCPAPAAG